MKRLFFAVVIISAIIGGIYGKSVRMLFAPDRIFIVGEDKRLVVANRAERQLWLLSEEMEVEKRLKFEAAVTDLAVLPDGRAWVTCEGNDGWLYEIDIDRFSIKRKVRSGATLSAVLYNSRSGSLWVAQRFDGEVWAPPFSMTITSSVSLTTRQPATLPVLAVML